MFKKPSNTHNMFSMSGYHKKKKEPMPVFETKNAPVPVIRQDIDPAFTIGMEKRYHKSSGLEK